MASGGLLQPIETRNQWFVGSDKLFRWSIVDGAGAALDCSSFTFRLVMSEVHDLTSPVVDEDSGFSTDNDAGTDDRVNITLLAAISSTLDPDKDYYYWLWRDDAGFRDVMAHGPAIIQKAA